MNTVPFSLEFIEGLVGIVLETGYFDELQDNDGPRLRLASLDAQGESAGYLRLWAADPASRMDRMVHTRLQAGPVETQLFFIFGRSGTTMPHFHAQVVQFPPSGCVYNVDLLPRLDAVEYPGYFRQVFAGLGRTYRRVMADDANSCSQAPPNPMLATLMSPWGIGSQRTDRDEFERVSPAIVSYLEHYLELAQVLDEPDVDPDTLRRRDQAHLEQFFADELDPRAWNGVYRIVGEDTGRQIKTILQTPLAP